MRVRINSGAYGKKNNSHRIELVGMTEELRSHGYRMTAMEMGVRGSGVPVINVNLRSGPAEGAELDIPVEIGVEPYDKQKGLNAKVKLGGLRERLRDLYDLRDGEEIAPRVFIPNFEGDYLGPEDGNGQDGAAGPDERPRQRLMRQIAARRGATAFRDKQLDRFARRCAISECGLVDVLEAAHIRAYRRESDNEPANGILLRADLHTLFDLDLVAIDPANYKIAVQASVAEAQYRQFDNHSMIEPVGGFDAGALRRRWEAFGVALNERKPANE
jgi:hypothetical protein